MNVKILERKTVLGFFFVFLVSLIVSLLSSPTANAAPAPKVPPATMSTTTARNVNNDNLVVTVTSNRPAAQISYVLTTTRIYEDVRMTKPKGSLVYRGTTTLRPDVKNVAIRMYSLPNLPGTPWTAVKIAPSLRPAAPAAVQVFPSWKDDNVKVVWRQPSAGLIYQVKYYKIGSDPLTDFPDAVSPFVSTDNYTFKDVIFGSYKINVVAYRPPVKPQTAPVFATGSNFINFTIMPPKAPVVSKSTVKIVQDTKTSAVISWQTPPGATSDLKYKVYVAGDDETNTCAVYCTAGVGTPSVKVANLVEGSSYEITIESYYDENEGTLSETIIHKVPPPPNAPAVNKNDIKIVQDFNTGSAVITWKAPVGSLPGVKYKMLVYGEGITDKCATSIYCPVETQSTTGTIKNLKKDVYYTVVISSYYQKGYETSSTPKYFTLSIVL